MGFAVHPSEREWEAAVLICQNGSVTKTAEQLGIPYGTIMAWRQSQWWPEVEAKARALVEDAFIVKAQGLIDKGLEQMAERFDKGDPYTVNGKVKYRPLNMKALVISTGVMFDKVEKVLAKRKPEPPKDEKQLPQLPTDQRQALGLLADEFLRIASAKRVEPTALIERDKAVDGEIVEAEASVRTTDGANSEDGLLQES